MAFAQPLALLFGLLAIPIALLYLLKQRRRRMTVSTLLFWDQILRDEHRVTSLTKLRKLLSLLLQILFLLLIVFALARPVLSKELLGARRILLFVDASASMTTQEGDTTRFDEAKRLAAQVVRGMSLGDTLMLVSVADTPDILAPFTDSRKDLLDALDALEVGHAETRFDRAFALLQDLPPDTRETCVYVISDGAFESVPLDVPENTRFAYLPVGEAKDNVGITAFQLRPLPASPRDFEILMEAANETDEERTVPFEIRVGEGLLDAGELTLPAHGRATRSVRQFSAQGGPVEVYLDYADPFPLDNRAYAVLPEPSPIPVLLVTAGNLFLESALSTDDEIALTTVSPEVYAALTDRSAYRIFIFDRCPPEAAPDADAVFIGAWPAGLGVEAKGDLDKPIVTEWERDHPINRHLHLENVTIEKGVALDPEVDADVLIESFGNPLVLLQEQAGVERLLVAFDTTSSDLPLRVAFPILIANAVRYMAGVTGGGTWASLAVGAILSDTDLARYVPADVRIERVLAPDAEADANALVDGLLHVERAGVYRAALGAGEPVPLFAANMTSRRESRIAPSAALPVTSKEPLPEVDEGFRLGVEPWILLVVVGFFLSLVEWGLFHRRLVE